jgi:hypothetical protein
MKTHLLARPADLIRDGSIIWLSWPRAMLWASLTACWN